MWVKYSTLADPRPFTDSGPMSICLNDEFRVVGFLLIHDQHQISLFLARLCVAMSLGSLFQRVGPVNDRSYLPGLEQLQKGK